MKHARGHILVALTFLGAAGIGGTLVAMRAVDAPSPILVTDDEAKLVIAAASIEPDSLAVCGVSSAQAAAVASAALEHVQTSDSTLPAAYNALVSLRGQVSQAERAVRSGSGSADDLTQLQTQLAAQEASVGTRLQQLRDAAFAGLSSDQKTRLNALRLSSPLGLGYPYRVMDSTESDKVTLRGALANVRTCDYAGTSPDGACQSTIASADARADVSLADAGLQNIGAIRTAFASGMTD
ncbi:MAG: hypothetical protein ED559_08635 [Phycisphaera sp.]|nr:MAG: hypothetical protein ED559_08635 [Phycisphaera sp.]